MAVDQDSSGRELEAVVEGYTSTLQQDQVRERGISSSAATFITHSVHRALAQPTHVQSC